MDAPKRRRKGKIHAMPPEVRARIDELLRADRHTFAEIKAIMAAEFPEEEPLSTSGIHRYDARIRVYTEKMQELETHARILADKYGKNEETGNLLSQAVMTLTTDTALNLMASGAAGLDDVRKLAQTAHTALQGKQVSLKVRQQIEAEVREKVLAEQKAKLEVLKQDKSINQTALAAVFR